jgi:hypothetical protein
MSFGCCPLLGKECIQLLIGCEISVSLHSGIYNPPFVYIIGTLIENQRKERQENFPSALKGSHKVAK